MIRLTADYSKPVRPMGKQNGTNNGPLHTHTDESMAFHDMGVDFVRFHETHSPCAKCIDEAAPRLFLAILLELYRFLSVLIPELQHMPPVWVHYLSQDAFDAFFDIYDQLKRISSAELHLLIPQIVRYGWLKCSVSVSETAELLGYPDVYTFSHQFAAVMGVSPGEYKKLNRTE